MTFFLIRVENSLTFLHSKQILSKKLSENLIHKWVKLESLKIVASKNFPKSLAGALLWKLSDLAFVLSYLCRIPRN